MRTWFSLIISDDRCEEALFLLYIDHILEFGMAQFSLADVLPSEGRIFSSQEVHPSAALPSSIRRLSQKCCCVKQALAINTRHYRVQFRIQMLLLQVKKRVSCPWDPRKIWKVELIWLIRQLLANVLFLTVNNQNIIIKKFPTQNLYQHFPIK